MPTDSHSKPSTSEFLGLNPRTILIVVLLSGGFGSGSSALSSTLFKQDANKLEQIEDRLSRLSARLDRVDEEHREFFTEKWPTLMTKVVEISTKLNVMAEERRRK